MDYLMQKMRCMNIGVGVRERGSRYAAIGFRRKEARKQKIAWQRWYPEQKYEYVRSGGIPSSSTAPYPSHVVAATKASSAETLLKAMDFNEDGPPRFFCPIDCATPALASARSASSQKMKPLILYLPGIDGTGMAASSQFKRLALVFDVICFSVPSKDRTPFDALVDCIGSYLKFEAENSSYERKNVIIVGESFGGLLACAVALQFPQLVDRLCLVNPGTSFKKSIWATLNIGTALVGAKL